MKSNEAAGGGIFFIIILIILLASTGNKDGNRKFGKPGEIRRQEQKAQRDREKFQDDMDYEFGDGKYAERRRYARENGPSGSPRWMEPFAKVDMFGKPTVFSSDFMKR